MTKVMAIILNYNSIEDSKKCALLLKKQQSVNLCVTIIDNCSSDGRIEELVSFGEENDVFVIANKENRGYSAGNNIGLKRATELDCQYAMIINPDVEIREVDYVAKAVAKMEEDPMIAVLGSDVINMEGQHQNPMREPTFLEDVFWPVILVRNKYSRKLPYTCSYLKSDYCEKVSGCCFFIRMSFAEQVGYLDETVFLYSEEPILAAMVKQAGYREYYMKELVAYHKHKESEKGNPQKRFNILKESRVYYLDRYSGYGKLRKKIAINSMVVQNKFMSRKKK